VPLILLGVYMISLFNLVCSWGFSFTTTIYCPTPIWFFCKW